MAQARPQTLGGPASDQLRALATELVQYIGNAQTRYIEGVEAGDPPIGKNARDTALVDEVTAKIRMLVYGNAPEAHPNAPADTPHLGGPATPPNEPARGHK